MPCTKCKSDFNFFNWKLKCGECDDKYCTKCLKKREGIFYCEKCIVLLRRPPDRGKLMELKSKDLQDYLKKHNVSTHGLVEKQELVDLLCNKHIPVKPKRGTEKLTANFACSLPNFRESVIPNDFLESTFLNGERQRANASPRRAHPNVATPRRSPPPRPQRPPSTSPQFTPNNSTPQSPTRPPPIPDHHITIQSPVTPGFQPTTSTTEDSSPNLQEIVVETPEGSPLPPKYPKLSDFGVEEDLNNLSAKQLKTILTLNRVNYKGCVEKTELLDKVKMLWNDNYKQRTEEVPEDLEELCKLCMDAPLECVLLECGHIATCVDCGKKLAECPICRQYVTRVVRTFKA